jgi:hypothetical protein
MKNVTITLDEETARWARVEAAKAGKSLSRWIGERLSLARARTGTQLESVERFLQGPEIPGLAVDRPSREEMYAERLFRRHERTPLPMGPKGSSEEDESS